MMSTPNLAATVLRNPIADDEFLEAAEPYLISASPAMRRLLDQVEIVGPRLRIATIEGESGSGKHTFARLLYLRYSAQHPEIRSQRFTRWDARDWLLSQTDPQFLGGFIFLDRVDLLAAPGQALLLRTLKDLEFRQSGNLVIVASSECPLRELARNGQFLTELAHRLTSVRLIVPPLRERKEDIVPLANVFLVRLSSQYHLPSIVLDSSAIAPLIEHPWPGNLRELSSILESAVIESSGGVIRAEDLALPAAHSIVAPPMRTPEFLNLDAVIHSHILRVLGLNRGNKLRTARQLGVSRSTLYRLLEKRLTLTRRA